MSSTAPADTPPAEDVPVVRRIAELRATAKHWRDAGETIGVVPTMGGLHDGHLALARTARAQYARTIVTLFVNPAQFGPNEDLAAYPRDERRDRALLAGIGVDLLYAPTVDEMYPPGFLTRVTVNRLGEPLCGPFRPGHFAGVATVVAKLLMQSLPDAAYFGEKDYQQLQIIRAMVRDLDIPAKVVGVPTIRDPDGLALSSRNAYLSTAERAAAAILPRVLRELAGRLATGRPAAPELEWGRQELRRSGFSQIDYLTLADAQTLETLDRAARPARVFAAAWLGRTRLIDNMPVERRSSQA